MASPLYSPQTYNGQSTSWIRSNQTVIYSPVNQVPSAAMVREKAFSMPDGSTMVQPLDQVQYQFNDATKMVPLLDPTTGNPLLDANSNPISVSIGYVMAVVYSFEIMAFTIVDTNPNQLGTP
jgi:hypothetical protein